MRAESVGALGLPRWGRLAMSATGVVGTMTFFVLAFSPNLPMYGDSLTSYGSWAQAHRLDARRLAGLMLLTFAFYMVFGIYVATLVRSADPLSAVLARVAIVAIGVQFAIEVMQVSVLSVPATSSARDFGGSMADLGAVSSVTSLVPHAVFLGTTGTAALVSRAVPAWMAGSLLRPPPSRLWPCWPELLSFRWPRLGLCLGWSGLRASPDGPW